MLYADEEPSLMITVAGSKTTSPLPKIAGGQGSLHAEMKKCSRRGCGCASGRLHGPYYAFFWRQEGRLRKHYIRVADVATAMAEAAAARALAVEAKAVKAKSDAAAQRSWDEYRRLASTLKQIMEETNGGE